MSLVAVACGRGSRGVTTTALALAATWPAPAIVAECDPAGGALAARFGMEPVTGTLSLASTSRHGLGAEEVGAHVRRLPIGLHALVGPAKAEQAEGIARFWPTVAPVLARLGTDVIADCGRLTARPPTAELLRNADLCVLVAEPTLDGLEQAKDRALALSGLLREPALIVLLCEGPYNPAEVRGWLAEGRVEADLLGTLAIDDRAASLINGVAGRQKALARSTLLRSAKALSQQLHARLATLRPDVSDRPDGRHPAAESDQPDPDPRSAPRPAAGQGGQRDHRPPAPDRGYGPPAVAPGRPPRPPAGAGGAAPEPGDRGYGGWSQQARVTPAGGAPGDGRGRQATSAHPGTNGDSQANAKGRR
jgi:hypothetical protein